MSETRKIDHPKFSRFNVYSTPYKSVNGQEIPLHILIPKNCREGKHPLLVRIHGGYLVTGAALLADWMSPWTFDLAVATSSILVMPDYRLLPESNGLDILSDLSDVWTWILKSLPTHLRQLSPGIEVDLDRILCTGESAGGYLAIQSGILQPDAIKACIVAYPMVELDSPFYSKPRPRDQLPGDGIPVPVSVVSDHLAAMVPNKIVVTGFPPDRADLDASSQQNGSLTKFLGDADEVYPLRLMKAGKVKKLPFMFFFHGTDDTTVPIEDTEQFVDAYEKKFGKKDVLFRTAPGGHGFDNCDEVSHADWLLNGLEEVKKRWLA